jgi:heme A synthase
LLAVLVRFFRWRVGREGKPASTERIRLQAAGTLIILGWMLLTEIFAELNQKYITTRTGPDVHNVLVGQSFFYIVAIVLVVIVAIISIRSDSRKPQRVFNGLVLAVGLVAVLAGTLNMNAGSATNYWVSMELNLYGGLSLILFTAVGWFVERNDPQSRVGHATPDNAVPSDAKQ